MCHLGKRPAQAHGHVCERCERRLPGEGVPAVLTRLIRVGHLPRALATDHARGPRAERRGGALRERVARCARVAPAAAREAQPAVRVLEVLARALVGERLADADAELPELLAAPLAQLLEQQLHLVLLVLGTTTHRAPRRPCEMPQRHVGHVDGERLMAASAVVSSASSPLELLDGELRVAIAALHQQPHPRHVRDGARDGIDVREQVGVRSEQRGA